MNVLRIIMGIADKPRPGRNTVTSAPRWLLARRPVRITDPGIRRGKILW
jgi:hypothetical protein